MPAVIDTGEPSALARRPIIYALVVCFGRILLRSSFRLDYCRATACRIGTNPGFPAENPGECRIANAPPTTEEHVRRKQVVAEPRRERGAESGIARTARTRAFRRSM